MVKAKITVYEKPTCTTCRKLAKKLIDNGVDFEKVNYYIDSFSEEQLTLLLEKMKIKPSELLRRKGDAYKELNVKENDYSEEQILKFMIENHDLIERPIVEKGNKAVLARPIEKVDELF